jgi:hypothetical protein
VIDIAGVEQLSPAPSRPCRFDQSRQHLRLHDAVGAATAGIFGTDRARSTRRIAGITSSTSPTSSPILCRRPSQHGHAVASGSSTCRSAASAWAARRSCGAPSCGLPGGLVAGESLAGGRQRGADLQIAQLERELIDDERCKPLRALAEHHVFERCIATRNFSFSASSASTISVRAAVSVGRASGRISMTNDTCTRHVPR